MKRHLVLASTWVRISCLLALFYDIFPPSVTAGVVHTLFCLFVSLNFWRKKSRIPMDNALTGDWKMSCPFSGSGKWARINQKKMFVPPSLIYRAPISRNLRESYIFICFTVVTCHFCNLVTLDHFITTATLLTDHLLEEHGFSGWLSSRVEDAPSARLCPPRSRLQTWQRTSESLRAETRTGGASNLSLCLLDRNQ